jgi:hypothetical protein
VDLLPHSPPSHLLAAAAGQVIRLALVLLGVLAVAMVQH